MHRRRLLAAILYGGLTAVRLPLLGRGADDAPAAGKKYALLVGVKNYNKDQLRNLDYTENDVNDLAAVLKDAGYKRVVLMTQSNAAAEGDNDLLPTGENVRRQLKALLDDRRPGDTVLVAFSGHGVQFKEEKESYFCPMDAKLDDRRTLVSLAEVYKGLEGCAAGTKVLLADACRNDPLAGASKAATKEQLDGVTRPQAERPPGGAAALFSCSEGQRSYESEKLKHGVFFHFVIEGLKGAAANKKGEVTLQSLASYVTDEVPDQVKDDVSDGAKQRPNLVGDLFGSGPLTAGAALGEKEYVNSLKMNLVLIPKGKFTMGSPKEEDPVFDNARPQHEVEITKPFYLGIYPVTQDEYEQVTGKKNLSWFSRDGGGKDMVSGLDTRRFPVESVSWEDAKAFCESLNEKDAKKPAGWRYELPTEAEWEYACRAGTETAYSFGKDPKDLKDFAWSNGNSEGRTHEVGTRKPNAFGLYDMHGDVLQWCADWYGPYPDKAVKDPAGPRDGARRVLRGGTWNSIPRECRSARRSVHIDTYDGSLGFRVVLRPAARTP